MVLFQQKKQQQKQLELSSTFHSYPSQKNQTHNKGLFQVSFVTYVKWCYICGQNISIHYSSRNVIIFILERRRQGHLDMATDLDVWITSLIFIVLLFSWSTQHIWYIVQTLCQLSRLTGWLAGCQVKWTIQLYPIGPTSNWSLKLAIIDGSRCHYGYKRDGCSSH